MDIKFRDISYGIVEARAVIKLSENIIINEITILNKDGKLEVELPQKTFKAKDGKVYFIDIISFENEDQKNLFFIEIKEAYKIWRSKNKKVRSYQT